MKQPKPKFDYYRGIDNIKKDVDQLQLKLKTTTDPDERRIITDTLQKHWKTLPKLQSELRELNDGANEVAIKPLLTPPSIKHKNKIVLMLQYYDEPNVERRGELLEAIHANINNKHIDKIILYLENTSEHRPARNIREDIKLNGKTHVEFVTINQRLTYEMCIAYAKKLGYSDAVFIACNNDCYFDDGVNLLKSVNYKNGNRLLCFTRWDRLPSGKIEKGKAPPVWKDDYEFGKVVEISRDDLNILDYVSSDAWAFDINIKNFKSDYQLGTFNCEAFFTEEAHMAGVQLRNPSEFIKCIHIHNTNFRRDYAFSNKHTSTRANKLYPSEESPRTMENYINGVWRIRSEFNYVDRDCEHHEYTEYVVCDFYDICDTDE